MKKILTINLLLLAFWLFALNECQAQWTTMEPIPTPRTEATASTLNGKIYVIGGITEEYGPALRTVEVYDPKTNTWSAAEDYPIPVTGATSQVVHDTLFVIGGSAGENSPPLHKAVYAYEESGGSWLPRADLPVASTALKSVVVEDTIFVVGGAVWGMATMNTWAYDPVRDAWTKKQDLPARRGFHTVQAIGHDIYAIGGVYMGIPRNSVYRYEVESDAWYLPESGEWESAAPLPEPLSLHGSGKLDNEIYVFGGAKNWSAGTSSRKTWKLEIEPDTMYWVNVNADIPLEVIGYAHAVAADEKGRLATYLFSGATQSFYFPDGNSGLSGATLKFAPVRDTEWKYMAPMPTPRVMGATVTHMGSIYFFGGVTSKSGKALSTCDSYKFVYDQWSDHPADLPEPLCLSTAQVYGNTIYVIGGSDRYLGEPSAKVWSYDKTSNQWERKADLPAALMASSSVVFNDHIYVAGGIDTSGHAVNHVYGYDPALDQWETLPPLGQRRAFCGLHVDPDYLHPIYGPVGPVGLMVTGGIVPGHIHSPGPAVIDHYTATERSERLNFYYDPGQEGIHYKPDPSGWQYYAYLPGGRYMHGAGHDGESIIVAGGLVRDGQSLTDIRMYKFCDPGDQNCGDIYEENWEVITDSLPEMVSPFHFAFYHLGDHYFYFTVGGTTADFWTGGNGPFVTGTNLMTRAQVATSIHPVSPDLSGYLKGNYPNPFTDQTTIPFELQRAGNITLEISDMNGQSIEKLYEGFKPAGKHTITWNAPRLPAGIYCYRLVTEDGTATRKMIVQ